MAGKIIDMSKIKQVLQLHMAGHSNRSISKELVINKETVNNYVKQAQNDNRNLKELLKMEDPELESRFHLGNPAYSDLRLEEFMKFLPYLKEQLSCKHVTRYLVWQEYKKKYPSGYGRSQFFFHLKQNLVAIKMPSTVLTDSYTPGEKLFVDFAGDTLSYVDVETGEIIKVQVFIGTLPFSDYAYAICLPSQKVEDFLYGIKKCLEFMGGTPKILVTDNLKSAVVKADRYEPTLNRALEDMGNYYNFVVIPCQPYSPRQKALVEDQVRLVYRRVYATLRHSTFYSLKALNEAVWEKMLEHNQTRMQQRPYSREEHFNAAEKSTLGPLPEASYETKYYADLTVQLNGFIYLGRDKHYYSVPYTLIGKKARIIYTRSLVKVFVDNKLVATHPRITGFGYTKIDAHLASNARAITSRSPEYYKKRAGMLSQPLETLISNLFSSINGTKPPEYYYKTCDMFFRLQKTYPREDFDKACRICTDNQVYRGKALESIVKNVITARKEQQESTISPEPTDHRNMRGTLYYK